MLVLLTAHMGLCWQTDGFIQNGKVRKIPFEMKVVGDKAPIYGETLEDLGRFNDDPQLPFNAYGTLALARQEFETNSGSSQVFWLLKARWPAALGCSLSPMLSSMENINRRM